MYVRIKIAFRRLPGAQTEGNRIMMKDAETHNETIHETVRDAYASRVKGGSCCGPASGRRRWS